MLRLSGLWLAAFMSTCLSNNVHTPWYPACVSVTCVTTNRKSLYCEHHVDRARTRSLSSFVPCLMETSCWRVLHGVGSRDRCIHETDAARNDLSPDPDDNTRIDHRSESITAAVGINEKGGRRTLPKDGRIVFLSLAGHWSSLPSSGPAKLTALPCPRLTGRWSSRRRPTSSAEALRRPWAVG